MLCMDSPAQERHSNRYVLRQAGMEHWVASDEDAYLAAAVEAAKNPARLAQERSRLRERFLASPLCDHPARARDRESLFREGWLRWCARQGVIG